jgi:DNA-binding response OmpR family regulator
VPVWFLPFERRGGRVTQRVLVVEDELSIRQLLASALEAEGYSVRTACNGEEGLILLEAWRPRLVLLDLMMPVLDGWSFRARQLARPDLTAIPVLVLSATHLPHQDVLALHPAAIIRKPFDLERLLALVATHFKPRRSSE